MGTKVLPVGGNGDDGAVSVRLANGKKAVELLALPKEAVIGAGTTGRGGRLTLYNSKSEPTVNLTSADGKLDVGGGGVNGSVSVTGADGMPLLELLGRADECVLGLGQSNRPGRISVFNASGAEAVRVDGATGDILIANADCAEEFDLADDADVEPGMVVVLTDDGGITASTTAYDTRVAGVVSGAGAYRPGLVLDRRTTGMKRLAVALLGKVYCRVDASTHPVRIGDLLTSSDRVGHAMRATDPQRAFGAVIGKALAPLAAGSGVIPVLIALQ